MRRPPRASSLQPPASSLSSGFTLMELMIVIAVLVVLMAALAGGYSMVQERSRSRMVRLELKRLSLALSQHQLAWGDYPPSSLAQAGIATNGINDGIESLVAHLARKGKGGPFFQFEEARLKNADGDAIAKGPHGLGFESGEAFEYQDVWGNPYVYVHFRDYAKPAAAGRFTVGEDQTPASVTPGRSKKTGEFFGATSFQLWSCGPDGVNQNGGGDDIPSW